MNVLVFDVGTTSIRGIVFNAEGKILDSHSVLTPLIFDKANETIEQSPEVYFASVLGICRRAAENFQIDAISITAFRSAITMVDRDGKPLRNFIMWQDTRNSVICDRLKSENKRIYQTGGATVNTVFTGSKLTWVKENEPDIYERAYKTLIVPDYIIHLMTGEFSTDHTYGSRTHLMNLRTLNWDEEMCQLFKVDREKLCDLVPQGSISGSVSAEFSKMSGIREGTPVITAGGDQQCGALGLGVLDNSTIEVNSGTGAFVISYADQPYLENPAVICNVAAVPGKYTQEMNIIASASAVDWLIREFFPEYWGETPNFDAVNRIAEETPPGARGLLAVPHFQGCGSRDWNPTARAGFWGFALGTHKQDMIRALYEGIAAEISKSIDSLPEICRKAGAIAVAGGLSRSDIYNQILCDMTGKYLLRSSNSQATARGAFVSAAVTLGLFGTYAEALQRVSEDDKNKIYKPDLENTAFYVQYKEQTEKLFKAGLQ